METSTETTREIKSKNRLRVLFPGVLFTPLLLVGWGNSIVWLFFGLIWVICALWCFLLAVPNLISIVMKNLPVFQTGRLLRLLVITLTIPLAFFISLKSSHTANAYAIDVAQTIQNEIDNGGKSPEFIKGWEQTYASDEYQTYYGKYGAKYKVVYRAYPEEKKFRVRVVHFFEYVFYVEGGEGQALKAFINGAPMPLDYYK